MGSKVGRFVKKGLNQVKNLIGYITLKHFFIYL